ncbi:rhodanese-like domain-containing protein [Paenibacillus sp. J31TS4]|uniref:rhodanese-like domain-containing protein n=1 Tax=Paenibacillus sp. J31TS4 TaxID=2807195 RepID=UPI0027961022|nr:rhodanese-like domain-containing protein [Paenibacillus sp. J31TS4]
MSTIVNVLLVVLVVWFLYSRFAPAKGLRNLSGERFKTELDESKGLLVDVREPHEFQAGHIPGARNVPLSQLNGRLSDLPKDKELFLYCRSGMRSKSAARVLQKNGYGKLAHLQGGIGAWPGKLAK